MKGIDNRVKCALFYVSLRKIIEPLGAADGQVVALDDIKIKGDEFWDYNEQIDLEAFSTKDFFSTLSKQSTEVTSALARQKDQVRQLP